MSSAAGKTTHCRPDIAHNQDGQSYRPDAGVLRGSACGVRSSCEFQIWYRQLLLKIGNIDRNASRRIEACKGREEKPEEVIMEGCDELTKTGYLVVRRWL